MNNFTTDIHRIPLNFLIRIIWVHQMNHRFSNYLGSIASVLLGKFCPLCYPVIGGFLTAIGFGFVVKAAILKGLLLILLGVGFLGLWRSYKTHKNPWPIRVALPAAILLYMGKYHWPGVTIFYTGIFGLIGAVAWDFIAAKSKAPCSACENSNVKGVN